MRPNDLPALAQEYRKRGWEWIALYLEHRDAECEEYRIEIESRVGSFEILRIAFDDPFVFFSRFLRDLELKGTIEDATACILNDCCRKELIAPTTHQTLQ